MLCFCLLFTLPPIQLVHADSPNTWHIIERGDSWNKYQNGSKPEFRIQSFNDLVNYQDANGTWNPNNLRSLTHNADGSWELNQLSYRIVLEKTRKLLRIYPDRNNQTVYWDMNLPTCFKNDNGQPFWKTMPSININNATIIWSFAHYNIGFRFLGSGIRFLYTMKDSSAQPSWNFTVSYSNISYDAIPFYHMYRDANGTRGIPAIVYNESRKDMNISIDTNGLVYPIVADPSYNFQSTSTDGWIYLEAINSYANVHNAVIGMISTGDTMMPVGQEYDMATGRYGCLRAGVFFDASSIPDDASLNIGTLGLYFADVNSILDFNVTIQNGMPNSPHMPLEARDYYYCNYSGSGGSKNTSTMWGHQFEYININLNSTGLGWINKTGYTKLLLRSSRDINSRAPVDEGEYIYFGTQEDGHAAWLNVSYTVNTSTNVIPFSSYTQYSSPLNVTINGNSDLTNVSLFYRWSISNLSRSWNKTYESYLTGNDKWITIAQSISTVNRFYQTFTVNITFITTRLWFKLNKTGTVNSVTCSIVYVNATGVPTTNTVCTSGAVLGAKVPVGAPQWVQFNFSNLLRRPVYNGQTYAVRIYGACPVTAGNVLRLHYDNTSSSYGGGKRWRKSVV